MQKRIIKTRPFDPAKCLGDGCTFWRGPVDGDGLSGEEDVCSKAMAITEVELTNFVFRTCLKEGENSIDGEEKIRRLNEMSDFVGFGPGVFLGLWVDYQINKESSDLEWLQRNFGVTFMDFPGAILRFPRGRRAVLCLCRDSDGDWLWVCRWLGAQWSADRPSVGCAS